MSKKKRRKPHKKTSKTKGVWGKNAPVLLAIVLLCAGAIILYTLSRDDKKTKTGRDTVIAQETVFKKEGSLIFIDDDSEKILKEIDIEVAVKASEMERGLMYRKTMQDNQGMLFVYEREGLLGMWMKNTYISLDIIFVNKDHEIVTIYKNTVPLQMKSLLSSRDAMYVVEVVAGFCDTYKIKEGDRVRFTYS